jgi:hypothetical protein
MGSALTARIKTRDELKGYALRALGAPVIVINVEDTQLEDRIDDALDMFWEYHADGSELVFLNHAVTQDDLDNKYITLPDGTLSVVSVMTAGDMANGIANTNNLQYKMYFSELLSASKMTAGGLSTWYITQSYLTLMNNTFGGPTRLNYNMHHGRLDLLADWPRVQLGDFIAVEAYRAINPEKVGPVYNDRWLKKYVTALFKKQWGSNLTKFTNITLPGGVTSNGERISDEAAQQIKDLEEELRSDYELPVDFYMG